MLLRVVPDLNENIKETEFDPFNLKNQNCHKLQDETNSNLKNPSDNQVKILNLNFKKSNINFQNPFYFLNSISDKTSHVSSVSSTAINRTHSRHKSLNFNFDSSFF